MLVFFYIFTFSYSTHASSEKSTVASADNTVSTINAIHPTDGTTDVAVMGTIFIKFNKYIAT